MPQLDLSVPRIMGILNVTPDSFSDGGRYDRLDAALYHAERMVINGADILDVGGESTRPGAQPVSEAEELDRVIPVIEALSARFDRLVSIDTSKPTVMREAVAAGAGMINDVNALRAEGAVTVAAEAGVPVCLMHMQGEPRTMQRSPHYDDVVAEVRDFLLERARICEAAGVSRQAIVLDPGFGFGKTLEHNLELLQQLPVLCASGYPVLAGISRKSMIGALTGREVDDRLAGSLAMALLALEGGARILRVHDVAETRDVLRVWTAVRERRESGEGSKGD
ncbi:dihydropteroate synthase [endosymbiont of unidentified scaly snail isolate Monju]|uniref:dihydropteroate synthase n=1 Tax=endosymbiont of unidentified scaly snail isolate Monju TaxID=1248727 RepID=UPI00038920B3|nr:dihydropteroate synthase [endosymbiont of unidentified scaly snail isolate Monju]BAN69394.1 dihydropteroate synthase [endosymbiont of unidentified scaly snail isolate Monju]